MSEEVLQASASDAKTDGPRVPAPPANVKTADDDTIAQAVDLLRRGEVVAFPTETVYGLGANAANYDAVAKIFKLKGRPTSHPLIVHIANADQMSKWARDIPEIAFALAKLYWPGPLTLVLKRADGVLDLVTGGQDTIALRVPSHPVALKLLDAFGGGVAAPSANKFGRVSPTLAKHVHADFKDHVPLILDGGPTRVGIESTIVDCTVEPPRILRPGGIGNVQLEPLLGKPDPEAAPAPAPRVSGSLPAHYAPRAAMRILKRVEILAQLGEQRGKRVFVLGFEVSVPRLAQTHQRIVPVVSAEYQRELYAALRDFDAAGADVIFVEAPPRTLAWTAVWDRLERAAAGAPEKPKRATRGKGRAGTAAEVADDEAVVSPDADADSAADTDGEAPDPSAGEAPAAAPLPADVSPTPERS